jgi:hypothetical protein
MIDARRRIFAACKANNIAFLNSVSADNVRERIEEGVLVCAGRDGRKAAEIGRQFTKRTMAW